MRLIHQKKRTDCGVACLAMLAGISWKQAKVDLFGQAKVINFRTTKEQMLEALRRRGVHMSGKLVRCANPEVLTKDALLKTNPKSNGNWHWAVWDAGRKKILDPYYKRTRVQSYLKIVRRTSSVKNSAASS